MLVNKSVLKKNIISQCQHGVRKYIFTQKKFTLLNEQTVLTKLRL